ncbi:type II toxin-antitoxin system RelE/ParE family toxin [Myxosarcina sp. GI1(2024)]
MESRQWEIRKYVTADGACPFDEWFDKLDSTLQARIDVRLDRVRLGNFGDRKSLKGGISELRFQFGAGYRVYFGLFKNQIVLLLVGGSKRTQKKDIKIACRLWQ